MTMTLGKNKKKFGKIENFCFWPIYGRVFHVWAKMGSRYPIISNFFFQIQKVHVQTIILGGFLEGHVAIAKNKIFFSRFLGGRVSNFAK